MSTCKVCQGVIFVEVTTVYPKNPDVIEMLQEFSTKTDEVQITLAKQSDRKYISDAWCHDCGLRYKPSALLTS